LPTRPYKPGIAAPPHLSPFGDSQEQGYVPDRQREINNLAGVATIEAKEASESESDFEADDASEHSDDGKGDADSSSGEEEASEEKEVKKPAKKTDKEKVTKKNQKLKKDLEKEQQEMGKMLMTNRQRKLYQQADKEVKK
jgi:pescadillo protein